MEDIKGLLGKAEDLVLPLSALITFAGDDIKALAQGGPVAVWDLEATYLSAWHPPTFLGVMNCARGPLGSGAMTSITGWTIDWAGKKLGIDMVSKIGGILQSAGGGVMAGAVGDLIVRPTKYNPDGQSQITRGEATRRGMRPVGREVTGKAPHSSALMPR